jgi:hypothetical protein
MSHDRRLGIKNEERKGMADTNVQASPLSIAGILPEKLQEQAMLPFPNNLMMVWKDEQNIVDAKIAQLIAQIAPKASKISPLETEKPPKQEVTPMVQEQQLRMRARIRDLAEQCKVLVCVETRIRPAAFKTAVKMVHTLKKAILSAGVDETTSIVFYRELFCPYFHEVVTQRAARFEALSVATVALLFQFIKCLEQLPSMESLLHTVIQTLCFKYNTSANGKRVNSEANVDHLVRLLCLARNQDLPGNRSFAASPGE